MQTQVYATHARAALDARLLAARLETGKMAQIGRPLSVILVSMAGNRHVGRDALLALSVAVDDAAQAAYLRGEPSSHLRHVAQLLAELAPSRATPIEDPPP